MVQYVIKFIALHRASSDIQVCTSIEITILEVCHMEFDKGFAVT